MTTDPDPALPVGEPGPRLPDRSATFTTGSIGEVTVVGVVGEIDEGEAADLTSVVAQACRTAPAVVVDLTRVTFLGSRGLSALLAVQTIAADSGSVAPVVVDPAQRGVRRVLELTGLVGPIPVHPSVADALRALNPD